MTTKSFKKLIPFAAFLLLIGTLSSCNRGMGCPNNFSLNKTAVEVVKIVPQILIKE